MAFCADCGGAKLRIDTREGTVVCTDCGLVDCAVLFDELGEFLKERNESDGFVQTRMGPAFDCTDPLESVGTVVGTENGTYGLHRWALRSSSGAQKMRLLEVNKEISAIFNYLDTPAQTRRTTEKVYKRVVVNQLGRGQNHYVTLVCCLVLAAKWEQQPLDLDSIVKWLEVDKEAVLRRLLRLEKSMGQLTGLVLMKNSVETIWRSLKVDQRLLSIASDACEEAEKLNLVSEGAEEEVAAAIVYLVTRYAKCLWGITCSVIGRPLKLTAKKIQTAFKQIKVYKRELLRRNLRLQVINFYEF